MSARHPRARAVRALPFSFALYVFEATLAALCALPFSLESLHALGGTSWTASQVALALDSVTTLAPALRVASGSTLLALALLALLSPWLQMSWYAALSDPLNPLRALGQGARLVLRACIVTVWIWLLALLAALPFLILAAFVHSGLAASTDARFHDLALLGTLAPLAPIALLAWVIHDLARARALRFGALHSTLRALRVGLRPALLTRALLLSATGYAVVVLVQWQSAGIPAGSSLRFLLTVSALQCALLARLFLRSLWLASALACMHPELEPVAVQT
ncbi:MAG: hypothetical protein JWN04_5436 [Myxococcaceae bacterium]|nr:hypothetical protein [Myxococcaceae bacterium]